MRRSTIAACLLVLSPCTVRACFDHAEKPGWLEERPSFSWELPGRAGARSRWDEAIGVSAIAGGSGACVLIAVSVRAVIRASRRHRTHPIEPAGPPSPLVLPADRPFGLPILVHSGHEPGGPIRVAREDSGTLATR